MERTSSSWMTCQPNWVCTGVSVYFPFSSLESASAKGLTKVDGVFQSRSRLCPSSPGPWIAWRGPRTSSFLQLRDDFIGLGVLVDQDVAGLVFLVAAQCLALLYSASISSSLMGCAFRWSWTRPERALAGAASPAVCVLRRFCETSAVRFLCDHFLRDEVVENRLRACSLSG